jgi:hypothetical protein
MSVAAALPVTLLLDKAPTVELSLSNSVAARSLTMSYSLRFWDVCSRIIPRNVFLGRGFGESFFNYFFCLYNSSFLLSVVLPVSLLLLIATSSKDFILTVLTGKPDEFLAAEEDDDGGGALRRGQ